MRAFAIPLIFFFAAAPARAERLKELVDVEGFRGNPLVGVGLVVGLAGTGDDPSSFNTRRPLAALLKHLGSVIDPTDVKAKNVALVTLTAELPPFARAGMRLDVTVSSMATARSLQGGTLISAPLEGADHQVYALAQGPLTLGGFSVDAGGAAAKKNHTTVGRIPSGARVERPAPGALPEHEVVLLLREPDFTTASRIAAAVDQALGPGSARVRDPAAVAVAVAPAWHGRVVALIAALEALEAAPDSPGRVIVDERTGTIVVGANVTLSRAAIAHGGLTVSVTETKSVSQPGPLSKGQTVVSTQTKVDVDEHPGQLVPIGPSANVSEMAAALNAMGVKPRDLVSILQALKAAGALHAEIEVL